MECAQKLRLCKKQGGRQFPGPDQALGAVTIAKDRVEQRGTLDKPPLDARPFGRGKKHGQRIQLPGPLHSPVVAVYVVGDSLLPHDPPCGFKTTQPLLGPKLLEIPQKSLPVWLNPAPRSEGFLKGCGHGRQGGLSA